jgi:tetratricopeptide (TPR) repeat protein
VGKVSQPCWHRGLNDLAWLYATRSDKEKRDPKKALQLARQAIELLGQTPGAPPQLRAAFLDTLAEALLIDGQVDEALRTEKSAAELDPSNRTLADRVERFRQAAQKRSPAEHR